ncbi:hypothetical protein [Tessaracoccus coleopterorum]|uniref:hypothetical protein n=1 Tax=Tessaracoccus coleopterorum TaxID=2714950 RepID=UPI0018D29E3F|nr:hypothetical protein [Tessaracoccus coleopterorum]
MGVYPWFIAALLVLGAFSRQPVVLLIFLFAMATLSSVMMPAIQTRLLDVSGDAQTLASALNHASLNIGNSMGAALAGAVIAAGFGLTAPAWLGASLAALGLGLALVSGLLQRRGMR